VYFDSALNEMTVYAPDEHQARQVLLRMSSLQNFILIEESVIIQPVDQYTLQSGRTLQGGVRLRCNLSD
jgi:hypothetical protein